MRTTIKSIDMFYRLKVLGNAMVTLPIPKRHSIHLVQPGLVKIKSSGSLGTKKPNWISRLSEWRRRCQAAAPSADTVARHRSRAGNDPSVSQSVFTIKRRPRCASTRRRPSVIVQPRRLIVCSSTQNFFKF